MLTYAFIANSEGFRPEDYHWEYENKNFKFKFFATSGMEMTKKYAKKLVDEGFKGIDLCGDFDADQAKEVALVTEGKIDVDYAKYFESEMKKLEKLEELGEYGIIVMADGLPEGTTKTERIVGSEFNTTIVLVDSDETAQAAAIGLVERGIDFIELCGYFNEIRAGEIIDAIDGRVPVGYCGS
jgi:hypothetical protein